MFCAKIKHTVRKTVRMRVRMCVIATWLCVWALSMCVLAVLLHHNCGIEVFEQALVGNYVSL